MFLPRPGDGVVSFGAWVLPVSQSSLGGLSTEAVQVMKAFFLLFFLIALFLPGCNLPPPFIAFWGHLPGKLPIFKSSLWDPFVRGNPNSGQA